MFLDYHKFGKSSQFSNVIKCSKIWTLTKVTNFIQIDKTFIVFQNTMFWSVYIIFNNKNATNKRKALNRILCSITYGVFRIFHRADWKQCNVNVSIKERVKQSYQKFSRTSDFLLVNANWYMSPKHKDWWNVKNIIFL